jgi:hypothetical protein
MANGYDGSGKRRGTLNYKEDTLSYNIRLRKAVLRRFTAAFQRERERIRAEGGHLYVNGVISELLMKYVEAVEKRESRWDAKETRERDALDIQGRKE